MKLLKISVPDFRNLQNVKLTFEPDLSPAVFPIASQNGGGKSTLLQLIFILLNCTADENKKVFIKNTISADNKINNKIENKLYCLAKFDFLYKNKTIKIAFNIIEANTKIKLNNEELRYILRKKQAITQENQKLELELLETVKRNTEVKASDYEHLIFDYSGVQSQSRIESEIQDNLRIIEELSKREKKANKDNDFLYSSIISIDSKDKIENKELLFYCAPCINIDYDFAFKAFKELSKSIFIAAPSTQPFIFLNKASQKELFNNLGEYCKLLINHSKELKNFYLYSQLIVYELIETFKQARDEDWKEAINSSNLSYGSKFKILVDDFHSFLGHDKYILPSTKLDNIVVQKQISETERIELEPEDLSHGELRRLGLYAWIKYNIPENSIILIDEVENALHPDWQYNIADELASWGNNQYLLATHSLHLCEALTPKHVKEIEPKMCKPDSKALD